MRLPILLLVVHLGFVVTDVVHSLGSDSSSPNGAETVAIQQVEAILNAIKKKDALMIFKLTSNSGDNKYKVRKLIEYWKDYKIAVKSAKMITIKSVEATVEVTILDRKLTGKFVFDRNFDKTPWILVKFPRELQPPSHFCEAPAVSKHQARFANHYFLTSKEAELVAFHQIEAIIYAVEKKDKLKLYKLVENAGDSQKEVGELIEYWKDYKIFVQSAAVLSDSAVEASVEIRILDRKLTCKFIIEKRSTSTTQWILSKFPRELKPPSHSCAAPTKAKSVAERHSHTTTNVKSVI